LNYQKRLERAEGTACAQFASARRGLFPESGAEWIECAGAYAVFDGAESPVTQSFGLGIFEKLSQDSLQLIEDFFITPAVHLLRALSPRAAIMKVTQQLQAVKHTKSPKIHQPAVSPDGTRKPRSIAPTLRRRPIVVRLLRLT